MASANENTSRPQWPAWDSGVKNWPSDERGPKLNSAIRQPHPMTKAGVRQPTRLAASVDIDAPPRGEGAQKRRRQHRVSPPAPQTKVADGNDLTNAWLRCAGCQAD